MSYLTFFQGFLLRLEIFFVILSARASIIFVLRPLLPLQVVGKSCKPIPVMILGVFLGRKRYPLLKYLFVLLIVVGVALFMFKDGAKSAKEEGAGAIGVGEVLLMVSLACDGLTGAVQERMKAEHATKSGHMMVAMNKWSILYLGAALTFTGEIW